MAGKKASAKPFETIAGHPALDFVNTLDDRFSDKPLELLRDYDDLLRFVVQAGLIAERQFRELKKLELSGHERGAVLAEAIELREALAAVLYGQLGGEEVGKSALKGLSEVFKRAAGERRLVFNGGKGNKAAIELSWEFKDIGREGRSPVWLLAQAANDLLTSSEAMHIRSCASPTCRWVFLDVSKNHSRRWCDMKVCGNRSKARRFARRWD